MLYHAYRPVAEWTAIHSTVSTLYLMGRKWQDIPSCHAWTNPRFYYKVKFPPSKTLNIQNLNRLNEWSSSPSTVDNSKVEPPRWEFKSYQPSTIKAARYLYTAFNDLKLRCPRFRSKDELLRTIEKDNLYRATVCMVPVTQILSINRR